MEPSNKPDGSAKLFNIDLPKPVSLVEALFGEGVKVIHPCDAFAQRAGIESWAAALIAMKCGKIVTATGPQIGRTLMDYNLFVKQVEADGLTMIVPPHDEFGFISVGLREHFPAATLERVEREAKGRAELLRSTNPFRSL